MVKTRHLLQGNSKIDTDKCKCDKKRSGFVMPSVIESIQFLKEKPWVDLTHEVTSDIPYFSAFQPLKETTLFTVEKAGFFAKKYELVSQYGTHLDAPIHFAKGQESIEALPLKELVLPLVVIHKEQEVAENPDYELTVADLLAFESEFGKIPSDSFVAFASGWSTRWQNHHAFYNDDPTHHAHTPGWSLAALQFLNEERAVQAIGHETLDTDSGISSFTNNDLVCERYWLSQGKFQVEVLNNLQKIPATGAAIILGVPKIKGAPGFTIRAFAILPE